MSIAKGTGLFNTATKVSFPYADYLFLSFYYLTIMVPYGDKGRDHFEEIITIIMMHMMKCNHSQID